MNREDIQFRDRLLMLAECSNPHKPFNVKRKSSQSKALLKNAPKLSMQDFVRMDPSYTPDIEHLVFPTRKRNVPSSNSNQGKTRSRLVEMFALSRHLQQRSADRETKVRQPTVNRSVDSALEGSRPSVQRQQSQWASEEPQPVRSNRPSPDSDMAATRGSNVSILHLRSTSEPWETSPTPNFTTSAPTSSVRPFPTRSSATVPVPGLTKHQSLGGTTPSRYTTQQSFHSGGEINSADMFLGQSCNRELSPVRWCDREVDGVYLGRSGWVQVQQRSLDENKRTNYQKKSTQQSQVDQIGNRRTGIKLAEYCSNTNMSRSLEAQRPFYLPLKTKEYERSNTTPSPSVPVPESYSPPSVTPIISPPPAFQDKASTKPKTRTFFGKQPFLPRSNAIIDSDASPPPSPQTQQQWKPIPSSLPPPHRGPKKSTSTPSPSDRSPGDQSKRNRIPQAKSLEDTTTSSSSARRNQFVQKYGESSSSSSSSMGFRSLDSYVPRQTMPRLSENTDSSIDVYEDADEEDNNSSSLNLSVVSVQVNNPNEMHHRKISPNRSIPRSNRSVSARRSPGGSSDAKQPTSPSSSSSSSSLNEFPSRSPQGTIANRSRVSRSYQNTSSSSTQTKKEPGSLNMLDESGQRVRRSRSLQLPEKRDPNRLSPQQAQTQAQVQVQESHRIFQKAPKRYKTIDSNDLHEDDLLREAEVVTGFLYGNRNRAQAQALLMHRYNNSMEEKPKEQSERERSSSKSNNGFNVFYVGKDGREAKQKIQQLQRGSTTPNFNGNNSSGNKAEKCCCEYWPHCGHRSSSMKSINNQSINQSMMRVSHSYPTHQQQRSLDSEPSLRNKQESSYLLNKERERSYKSGSKDQRSYEMSYGYQDQDQYDTTIYKPTSSIISSSTASSGNKHQGREEPYKSFKIDEYVREALKGAEKQRQRYKQQQHDSDIYMTQQQQQQQQQHNSPEDYYMTVDNSISLKSDKYKMDKHGVYTKQHQQDSGGSMQRKESKKKEAQMQCSYQSDYGSAKSGMSTKRAYHQTDVSYVKDKDSKVGARRSPNQLDVESKSRLSPSPVPAAGGGEKKGVQRASKGAIPKNSVTVHAHMHTHGVSTRSNSSSSSDVYVTTSDRTKSPKTVKSSGASTPLDEQPPEMVYEEVITRPGSAPGEPNQANIDQQQRSMSLPKSFLSASYSGQLPWRKRGAESLGSSPGNRRKTTNGTSHTAPVTPLHENSRRRSPLGGAVRRAKANSTPLLLDPSDAENRKWEKSPSMEQPRSVSNQSTLQKEFSSASRRSLSGQSTESVLQKFRKTFSLRFQKKGSKDSCGSDVADNLSEILGEPSEEESPQHVPSVSPSKLDSSNSKDTTNKEHLTTTTTTTRQHKEKDSEHEQKYKFGPLIWRSSKEKKKMNKAARNAKCNSGDSGIQIEMAPGGVAGDSSESHDTDPQGDDVDSPPAVRRRPQKPSKASRPHSELINQILIDKFKAELRSRANNGGGGSSSKHQHVRRTHSDLGGQRLLHWEARSAYRRMMSSPSPIRSPKSQSPKKKPPDLPEGVLLRGPHRRGQLRRSLSQPLDIDKLPPLIRTKITGYKGTGTVLSEDEHDIRGQTSDDEMLSDSESSIASLNERKKSFEIAMDEEMVVLAEAVFDHVAIEGEELAFRAGDVIEVLETANRDWWWGTADGKTGWFPAAFVRLRVSQEDTVEDCLAAMASGKQESSHLRRRTSISLLSNDQVRISIVRELVHTERDFVKVLQDVAEGYLAECRKRNDMFTKEQLDTIFINLEDILKFQSNFLKDLESSIDWDSPHKSCVGACFIKHKDGFTMYSDYCNSHTMATAMLQELYQYASYSKFFEACRLMRGLIEIPLDGYLLTPVQRICKYPLQLAELLKYTKSEHPDYEHIKEALDAMRGVAVLINERKRRMESLEKLAAWQQRVEGWEGEDLIETSSQLIHQGEVDRVTSGMWSTSIMLFLFDNQLVYCKKDILKRHTYVYKGRLCLETTEVIDVPDGKDLHTGVSVRHAIKLHSVISDKWLLVCCRSSTDKQNWMKAFLDERKLVAQDKSDGLQFHSAAKQLARVAAKRQKRPPRKPRNNKNYKREQVYMGSTLQLNTQHNTNSLGRKVGTWFTFGGNKKTRHQHRDVS